MRIVDFCAKSSGFTNFENTADRGSAVNFGEDSGLCLWIIDLSSALVGMLMVMGSSKLFRFSNRAHLNSCGRLLLELYCVIVMKHVAFFTIRAKLLITMAFPFTFPHVIVVSDLNKNIGGSTDLGGKKTRIGGFTYPYSPPPSRST